MQLDPNSLRSAAERNGLGRVSAEVFKTNVKPSRKSVGAFAGYALKLRNTELGPRSATSDVRRATSTNDSRYLLGVAPPAQAVRARLSPHVVLHVPLIAYRDVHTSRSGRVALESNDAGVATTVSTELRAKYKKRKISRTTYPATHAHQPSPWGAHMCMHMSRLSSLRAEQSCIAAQKPYCWS